MKDLIFGMITCKNFFQQRIPSFTFLRWSGFFNLSYQKIPFAVIIYPPHMLKRAWVDCTATKFVFHAILLLILYWQGAIATRFLIENSSFCFVNTHLAAHQSHTTERNKDIAQILKDASFPKIDLDYHFEGGGDGSMIMVSYFSILIFFRIMNMYFGVEI